MACVDLLVDMGMSIDNSWLTDIEGVVHEGRNALIDPRKERYAKRTDARSLAEVIPCADVFLGVSAPGVLKPEMVTKMAASPLILALANPRSEEHTSELQSLMRIPYAVYVLKKKNSR